LNGDIIIDNQEHLVHEFDLNNINERIEKFEVHPTAPLYGTKVPLATGEVGKLEKERF
jgi:tRNA pseudouridine13 synthase